MNAIPPGWKWNPQTGAYTPEKVRVLNYAKNHSQTQGALFEPNAINAPMGPDKREAKSSGRFSVRIESFRRKLLDIDNLYGGVKWFVDSIRYSKLIPDDSAKEIDLEVKQQKVKDPADERTEITIEAI